jgi:hypothetical protein
MLSADGHPARPAIPHFSRDMENALVTAARAGLGRPPARPAGIGRRAAAVAAVAVIAAGTAIGVDYAVGNAHSAASQGTAGHAVHIHTDAFWVDTSAQGTVTITLMRDYTRIDPAALRHALAEAGVPALVTANKVCYVPGPVSALGQVLSAPRHLADGSTAVTIYPAAIPPGSEISIGYFQVSGGGGIHITLVPEHASLTCTSMPPAAPGDPRSGPG